MFELVKILINFFRDKLLFSQMNDVVELCVSKRETR